MQNNLLLLLLLLLLCCYIVVCCPSRIIGFLFGFTRLCSRPVPLQQVIFSLLLLSRSGGKEKAVGTATLHVVATGSRTLPALSTAYRRCKRRCLWLFPQRVLRLRKQTHTHIHIYMYIFTHASLRLSHNWLSTGTTLTSPSVCVV
jgi:hypothetical protein